MAFRALIIGIIGIATLFIITNIKVILIIIFFTPKHCIKKGNNYLEYDGMWSSSLTESLLRGKPDNQSVELSTRISALNEILDVTTKPIIFDADNGGRMEHLSYKINSLERQGVSAIVLEDKIGLKRNSLFQLLGVIKND